MQKNLLLIKEDMNVLNVNRSRERATYCIRRARKTGYPIIVNGISSKTDIERRKREMGVKYSKVVVLTLKEYMKSEKRYDSIIINEIDTIFEKGKHSTIDTITY